MSRAQLEDRINYCRRELKWLESLKPTCHNCEHKKYQANECHKFGPVPDDFINSEECPDWSFFDVPF